jgi:urease accessory protein
MPARLVTIERRVPANARLAAPLVARAEVICLGYEERRRSRLRSRLENGEEAALFMPHGTVLKDGDLLLAVDGRLIRVRAMDEAVIDVTHPQPLGLLRIAYHFGNRHIPLELRDNALRLLSDNVLADMARQLGAKVVKRDAPFEPESGAYGGGHRHGHDATFEEDHALAKQSFARRWPEPPSAPSHASARHVHAAGNGHAHVDDHSHPHSHPHSHAQPKEKARHPHAHTDAHAEPAGGALLSDPAEEDQKP